MKLLDIPPNYLNKELASKICKNKSLMKKYIQKYDLWGGTKRKGQELELESDNLLKKQLNTEHSHQSYIERLKTNLNETEILFFLQKCNLLSYIECAEIIQSNMKFKSIILQIYSKNISTNTNILGWYTTNDFKTLFYYANLLLNCSEENDTIVGIGESPNKLIWAMECLTHKKQVSRTFINLAISNLRCINMFNEHIENVGRFIYRNIHIEQFLIFHKDKSNKDNSFTENASELLKGSRQDVINKVEQYMKSFENTNLNNSILTQFKEHNLINILQYFTLLNLDPNTIKNNSYYTVFYDRVESANSLICFCFLLRALSLLAFNNNHADCKLFIKKIKIIGMEGDYDEESYINYKIFIVQYTISKLFNLNYSESITFYTYVSMKIHLSEINYNNDEDEIKSKLEEIKLINFYNFFYTSMFCVNKINLLTSVPEQLKTNSRCILSRNYQHIPNLNIDIDEYNSHSHLSDNERENYKYCNVYYFIIFIMMTELNDWIENIWLIINPEQIKNISFNYNQHNFLEEYTSWSDVISNLIRTYNDIENDNKSIFL